MKDYFNERPAMIANKWGLRRTAPGEARCPDFHQDGAYLGEGIRTVDGWISLSHCGPGAAVPAIDFLARRWRPVPWSLAEATVRAAARGAPIASPVFGPKDALFFDERLVHRTAVGPNIQAHSAIESWFVAPSSYPDKARSDRALAVSHARLVMRPTAGRGSVAESVSDRLRPSNPFGALCNTITQSVRAFPGKRRD